MAQNPNGDPGVDPAEAPQVLAVDRDRDWTDFLGRALKKADIRLQLVKDVPSAIEALQQDDTSITSVITDGMRGEWPLVAEAAIEAGVTPVVVTRSSFALSGAEEMGVPTFGKQELQNNSLALERMIKIVRP